MSNITPNTTLEFFFNTGLSPTSENTLYFANSGARDNYFSAWFSYSVGSCTYQRENNNRCRVQVPISQLYNADYMRFKNWNFENKWYYAYVLNVNYINNETTEIIYEIDYMMTWMGDFSLRQCYIERQHVRNDVIGANIAEEGLPVGNYCTELQTTIWAFTKTNAIARIAVSSGSSGTSSMGGIYSGSAVIDCTTQAELNTAIKSLIDSNQVDSIVSVILLPKNLSGATPVRIENNTLAKPYTNIMGYVPRNKKLFCYPYKYCTIDNREGSTLDLMYEYMETVPDAESSGNMKFVILGQGYPSSCEIALFPSKYKGSTGSEHRITMTHFPICSFAVDSYQAYLAQKNAYYEQDITRTEAQAGINILTGAGQGALSGASHGNVGVGALYGATSALIQGVGSTIKEATDNMIINSIRPESPSVQKGNASSDLWFSAGSKGFTIYEKCITKNYAMMLDSYFDMYGYAIKQHMIPNMNARTNWTYIKTIGCDIGGSVPAFDAKIIEQRFDNGVRFWKDLNNIGNYSLDNSPI